MTAVFNMYHLVLSCLSGAERKRLNPSIPLIHYFLGNYEETAQSAKLLSVTSAL